MDKKTGYILYLDLLGYKNIIRSKDDVQEAELSKFVEEFISVEKLKTEVKKCHEHFEEDKLVIRCFSDNFIIFYESPSIDKDSLIVSLLLGCILLGGAVEQGYMLRGSIVFGDIYYSDSVVFGESIVKAYELESNHIEPNIVLSQDLKKEYEKQQLYDLDIISPFSASFNYSLEEARLYYEGIKKMIKRLNSQSIVDERTIAKYSWMIKEFNRYFENYAKIELTNKPYHFDVDYCDISDDV